MFFGLQNTFCKECMAVRVDTDFFVTFILGHENRSDERAYVHSIDDFFQIRQNRIVGINCSPPRIPYHDKGYFILERQVEIVTLVHETYITVFILLGVASHFFQCGNNKFLRRYFRCIGSGKSFFKTAYYLLFPSP